MGEGTETWHSPLRVGNKVVLAPDIGIVVGRVVGLDDAVALLASVRICDPSPASRLLVARDFTTCPIDTTSFPGRLLSPAPGVVEVSRAAIQVAMAWPHPVGDEGA